MEQEAGGQLAKAAMAYRSFGGIPKLTMAYRSFDGAPKLRWSTEAYEAPPDDVYRRCGTNRGTRAL